MHAAPGRVEGVRVKVKGPSEVAVSWLALSSSSFSTGGRTRSNRFLMAAVGMGTFRLTSAFFLAFSAFCNNTREASHSINIPFFKCLLKIPIPPLIVMKTRKKQRENEAFKLTSIPGKKRTTGKQKKQL